MKSLQGLTLQTIQFTSIYSDIPIHIIHQTPLLALVFGILVRQMAIRTYHMKKDSHANSSSFVDNYILKIRKSSANMSHSHEAIWDGSPLAVVCTQAFVLSPASVTPGQGCDQIFWASVRLDASVKGLPYMAKRHRKTRTCPKDSKGFQIGCTWLIHSGRTTARWCVARRWSLKTLFLLNLDPRYSRPFNPFPACASASFGKLKL